ncbi:Centromere protein X isoform 4 [Hibiscus syriacus]|uniref:Centromere protein X isoform 4 n=1 Tax=Hibiscus syriacus TaxID=106335 RepID=A0A6A2Y938_HIBSY|nr:protein MHF2 homolog isoform X1 [Hibiscus syriacus]XP_039045145.1 protein MHF2 homolog isoform X1 [Hibiscus syriacus]KAE8663479.1 Centromere protein X isoform 4 [Hibiscus syriacus]KAE8668057.1 Centromere protein X isoform 4 [Hibiscus syriacus]
MDKKRRKVKIEEQNQINSAMDDHETPVLEPDLTRDIFKQIWTRKAQEREGIDFHQTDAMDSEVVAGTSKKIRPTFANPNALKLSCELVRIFITEAVQRAATVAEGEGGAKVEAIHLERILPQLLLDF